jgi:hypothetical protein
MKWITPPDRRFCEKVDNKEAANLLKKGWKLTKPPEKR